MNPRPNSISDELSNKLQAIQSALADLVAGSFYGQSTGYYHVEPALMEGLKALLEDGGSVAIAENVCHDIHAARSASTPQPPRYTLEQNAKNILMKWVKIHDLDATESVQLVHNETVRLLNYWGKTETWAPINSAPKDGTVFLAHVPHGMGGYRFACARSTDEQWICIMSATPQSPTHWMPMPEGPQQFPS